MLAVQGYFDNEDSVGSGRGLLAAFVAPVAWIVSSTSLSSSFP